MPVILSSSIHSFRHAPLIGWYILSIMRAITLSFFSDINSDIDLLIRPFLHSSF